MIIDLERNEIVDLLPDRSAGTLADWLRAHPAVETIARDRAEVFAEGIREGAPMARHVLNRWHLLCNVSAAFQTIVAGHQHQIEEVAEAIRSSAQEAGHRDSLARRTPTAAERRSQVLHEPRAEASAEMERLLAAGSSQAGVPRALGLDRKTVRRWIRGGGPPRWKKPKRPSVLDPYRDHLEQRWRKGCRNSADLVHELQRQGTPVHPRVVREWATRRRRSERMTTAQLHKPPSARTIARLMTLKRDHLTKDETLTVAAIEQGTPALAEARTLVERFQSIIQRKAEADLDPWLQHASSSLIASFARGITKDLAAVRAAVTEPWSNGQTEGHINRLKLIKRQMYARQARPS